MKVQQKNTRKHYKRSDLSNHISNGRPKAGVYWTNYKLKPHFCATKDHSPKMQMCSITWHGPNEMQVQ